MEKLPEWKKNKADDSFLDRKRFPFPDQSAGRGKSVAERFGGLNLPILFEYLGCPEEPYLYTVHLQQMADTLKETHFDLFKRCSEESLGALKSKADFLNNLVPTGDKNFDQLH